MAELTILEYKPRPWKEYSRPHHGEIKHLWIWNKTEDIDHIEIKPKQIAKKTKRKYPKQFKLPASW